MKPDDFSIQTSPDPAVHIYYNGHAVVRLQKDGLHRVKCQPSDLPRNEEGQIKVLRSYKYKYFHEFGWCTHAKLESIALHGLVAKLGDLKFFLRSAGCGVALVGVWPENTTYTVLVIDDKGLHVAPGCTNFKNHIALEDDYRVRVWRN